MYVLRKLCEDALLDEFELLRPLATWHLALKWVVVLARLSTLSYRAGPTLVVVPVVPWNRLIFEKGCNGTTRFLNLDAMEPVNF